MYQTLVAFLACAAYASCTPLEKATRGPATCSETSMGDFKWTVQDFDYHASYIFTTPAHQNSWGYVNFNLSNPAVPDALASCQAASSQLSSFFYGTIHYTCTFDEQVAAPAPAGFTFDQPTGELRVDQEWVCSDQDPQHPTTFSASGQVDITLECTDVTWQNSNWTMGEFYSTRNVDCALVTLDLKPSRISAVA